MNPYEKKRRWKFFLLIFAIVIGTASVVYSDFFVKKMEREEQVQFQLYVKVTEQSLVMYDDDRFTDLIETITKNTKLPVIMTDGEGLINSYQGLDSTKTNYDVEKQDKKTYDPGYFERELRKMKKQHPGTPIIGLDQKSSFTSYYIIFFLYPRSYCHFLILFEKWHWVLPCEWKAYDDCN